LTTRTILPNEIFTTRLLNATPETVFRAFADPDKLKLWWGPDGFTNTFHVHDFSDGGLWEFTMHGPDGVDYFNQSRFVEVIPGAKVVVEHLNAPHFIGDYTFAVEEGKTRINWSMYLDTPEMKESVLNRVGDANQQNLNRLEEVLAGML